MKNLLYILSVCTLFFACGGPATDSQTGANNAEGDDKAAQKEAKKADEAKAKSVRMIPFPVSVKFEDAEITSVDYKSGKFNFGIGGESYQLGVQTSDAPRKMCANSAKGQHIHLIVDNKPYAAKYEAEFDYDIEDGEHHMLAFLSRSYHESIKTPKAHVAKKITVEGKSITASEDIKEPVLFYSRPKGTYVGKKETDKVMLDFYPVNVELGRDYQIKAEVNGNRFMISQWRPYYLEGLPMGENKVKLTLVDAKGNPIDAPLNPVERTFTLKADPVEEAQ